MHDQRHMPRHRPPALLASGLALVGSIAIRMVGCVGGGPDAGGGPTSDAAPPTTTPGIRDATPSPDPPAPARDASLPTSTDCPTADGGADAGADAAAPTFVDISLCRYSQGSPSAVIDTAAGKLLVVTQDGANDYKPGLFRCNLDGTGCTHHDISAGQGLSSGTSPSAAIDTVNKKLLVATSNGAHQGRPSLFRCELDGTACTHADISAGRGPASGRSPTLLVDSKGGKLIVVTEYVAPVTSLLLPGVFRCNLDGTSCVYLDVLAGHSGATEPKGVIDEVNGKLVVLAYDTDSQARLTLFRSNLDGTSSTVVDISAGQLPGDGSLFPAIDPINRKLLVVAPNASDDGHLNLFRCELDGTSCTHQDISAGEGPDPSYQHSIIVDTTAKKLLVAMEDQYNRHQLGVTRCNLDGTACTHTAISVGPPANGGLRPSAALDAAHRRLLVVTEGGDAKTGLFSIPLP